MKGIKTEHGMCGMGRWKEKSVENNLEDRHNQTHFAKE